MDLLYFEISDQSLFVSSIGSSNLVIAREIGQKLVVGHSYWLLGMLASNQMDRSN